MLVLATLLGIGVFCVAFLLRFLYALHSEIRLENERSARSRQIAKGRIPIAIEVHHRVPSAPAVGVLVRKSTRGFTVTSSNPGLVYRSEPNVSLPGTPMRRALTALSGRTVQITESSQSQREA